MRSLAVFSMLVLAAGCSGGEEAEPKVQEQAAQRASPPAPPALPPVPHGKAREVEEKSDLLEFTYGWPAEAAAIPKLAAQLEADLAKQRTEALATAREDKKARGADAPYNAHDFSKTWSLYGQSPRLLSLAAEVYAFTGGAHGNSFHEAVLWDREADAAVPAIGLFNDPKTALATLNGGYCRKLDEERAEKRRGEETTEGSDWMTECPPLDEQVIVPVDENKDGRFDLLRVLLAPYAAGPYVEGSYGIDLPITPATKKLLKPEYASSF